VSRQFARPVGAATDAALALGMANVIIHKELYDKPFVERYVHGWEKFNPVHPLWRDEGGDEQATRKSMPVKRHFFFLTVMMRKINMEFTQSSIESSYVCW